MYPGKIVVVLFAPFDANGAKATVEYAIKAASVPEKLSFVLPSYAQEETEAFLSGMNVLYRYFDYHHGLEGVTESLGDESFFLLTMGDCRFTNGWDNELYLQQHACGKKSLLSAGVWYQKEVGAELCLPALRESFDNYGIKMGLGLPVVNGEKPMPLQLADPALVFGPVSFLKEHHPGIYTLSYDAMAANMHIFLLNSPCVYPVAELPPRYLRRRQGEAKDGLNVERFERNCGISLKDKMITQRGKMGLGELQNSYEQVLPLRLRLEGQLKSATKRLRTDPCPYLVTGFIDFGIDRTDIMNYCLHFGFLSRLSGLPLLAYTGGISEKTVRRIHTNTQSFPGDDLPFFEGMTVSQHFKRSKILMMSRAAVRNPSSRYIAWVDFDILPHPLPSKAMPNFASISDGKIHMAMVGGIPDASFIYAPAALIPVLREETLAITQLDDMAHRGYYEKSLWQRLANKYPKNFCFHTMPKRQMLFLSLFDKELLSKQVLRFFEKRKDSFNAV